MVYVLLFNTTTRKLGFYSLVVLFAIVIAEICVCICFQWIREKGGAIDIGMESVIIIHLKVESESTLLLEMPEHMVWFSFISSSDLVLVKMVYVL